VAPLICCCRDMLGWAVHRFIPPDLKEQFQAVIPDQPEPDLLPALMKLRKPLIHKVKTMLRMQPRMVFAVSADLGRALYGLVGVSAASNAPPVDVAVCDLRLSGGCG
jgi:hypothetical protein